jgi:putative ABC transport system substrate-binding protein
MDLTLQPLEATSPSAIDAAFVRMVSDQAQALMILADPFMNEHVQKIADLSLKNRLPAIYGFREFADAGGLLSYGASLHWLNGRAAFYVDKIFKGANPSDLPIEQPTTFELVINLKTAKVLGVNVPPPMLATADQVIE